jgi:hypothetical protein
MILHGLAGLDAAESVFLHLIRMILQGFARLDEADSIHFYM